MAVRLAGIPEDLAGADLDEGAVHLTIDELVYPLEAVYGAAYVFIDRCWVFVDRPVSGKYRVVLTPKEGEANEPQLRAVAGE